MTLKLRDADEQSTVMTRSFSSMLLVLQYVAATIAGDEAFCRSLLKLPSQVEPLLAETPQTLKLFANSRSYSDFIFLAQGPLFGIASECMLKVTESSSSYAQVFHSLEFRHGPKSIAGPDTLITFLMSETSYDAETELLEEMKALGAATMAIANRVDRRVAQASDFAIELKLDAARVCSPRSLRNLGPALRRLLRTEKGIESRCPK